MKSFDIVEFDSYLSLLTDSGKDGRVRFPCLIFWGRQRTEVTDSMDCLENQKKFSIVKDGKILYIICGLIWVRDWSHAEGVLCVAKYGAL